MKIIDKFEGDYLFLSNHSPSTIYFENKKYKTITHAYQSLRLQNNDDAEKVRNSLTPQEAVKLSRKFQIKKNWLEQNKEIMLNLLRLKFDNPFLADKLILTKNDKLESGKTFLGELLMIIRFELNERKNNEHF